MTDFYNTTRQTGSTLEVSQSSASRQEAAILEFMTNQCGIPFTAEDIESEFGYPRASVSRAMRNLTKGMQIEKSSSARWKSHYGRSCYAWRVKPALQEGFCAGTDKLING